MYALSVEELILGIEVNSVQGKIDHTLNTPKVTLVAPREE